MKSVTQQIYKRPHTNARHKVLQDTHRRPIAYKVAHSFAEIARWIKIRIGESIQNQIGEQWKVH